MTFKNKSLLLFYVHLSLCLQSGCSCVWSSKAAELMLVLADGTSEESFSDTPRCPLQCTL